MVTKRSNPLRMDPTRTASLRRAFEKQLASRFLRLKVKLYLLLVEEDALGRLPDPNLNPTFSDMRQTANISNAGWSPSRWRFSSDPEKVRQFKAWLKTQIDLDLTGRSEQEVWEAYTRMGLQKGAGRAFDDTRRPQRLQSELAGRSDFYQGSRDEFLRSAFNRPVAVEKVQLLASRSLDELENVTTAMATRMTRSLTDGLVRGASPREIARDIDNDLDIGRGRALVIARTEIVRAHAEGQLMALEQLGVEEVGVAVEWSTAGDDHVCFPKWTLIETSEGPLPIQEVCAGMLVKTRKGFRKVLSTKSREYAGEMITVAAGDFQATSTGEHPYWTEENGWVPAKNLTVKHTLNTQENQYVKVRRIVDFCLGGIPILVYNLQVEGEPEYFADGLLVHNCELCQPLEGMVLKLDEAKGMLPRHPNCRCAWLPANVGEDTKGQKDTQASIGRALDLSVESDRGFERSQWGGADLEPDRNRPQSQVGNVDYLAAFSEAMKGRNE